MSFETRNFNTISPSALSLIGLKAHTQIPFARETASYLSDSLQEIAKHNGEIDKATFFKLLVHFENRYRTVDHVLSNLNVNNILEISSGYSFRGLNLCYQRAVHFIDTDLPEVISTKRKITETLISDQSEQLKGTLNLHPLNALDKTGFENLVDDFPEGPVAIINEGLLVYLNPEEKKELASIIFNILEKRGGYWITGDIYTKKVKENEALIPNENARRFREAHKIDENKFEDFERAEQFFRESGFEIIQRESVVTENLSCLDLLGDEKDRVIQKLNNSPHGRETWCLRVDKGLVN